jgi:hypothetical protein
VARPGLLTGAEVVCESAVVLAGVFHEPELSARVPSGRCPAAEGSASSRTFSTVPALNTATRGARTRDSCPSQERDS